MSIYFLGINGVIGSGAFLLPQTIYKDMNLMSVFVTICAALTVSMVALCYADLSSRFTGSGAAWLYSYHAFGRFTGYELGIYTWFLGCCTYAAEIVALLTILKTLSPVFSNHAVHYGIAIGIIVLFTIINLFGRTIVKLVDNLSSAAKMITILIFIIIGAFFIHKMNFTPVIPKAATLGVDPYFKHFGAAFSVVFYMFTGFSFIPIAVAFQKAVGDWGYVLVIAGMLISVIGVAFAGSFNTPSLIASLANEHAMLPKWIGKKNKHDAAWVAILLSAIITMILITQSYLFLVSCIVLASFIQYVPSILAVIKFKHTNEFPNNGFKLPFSYVIPALALIISCYMVTNFTWKTILVGVVVGVLAAVAYFFIEKDEKVEEKHQKYLSKMRNK
ncbi:APC family permease [Lactobacillus crispatus]|uniref:APC family permease n=1 Tax=Lactobacillus crispatus TaxID=47770 RepID=UPI0021A949E8|nr:APC family permease [Lactobacillus crispatus]MCT3539906.1 APC family permease [Lactobacillus crispatus]